MHPRLATGETQTIDRVERPVAERHTQPIRRERLMQALLALNQQVEIVVKPGRKAGSGSIRVAV